jgi:hypothetical protein
MRSGFKRRVWRICLLCVAVLGWVCASAGFRPDPRAPTAVSPPVASDTGPRRFRPLQREHLGSPDTEVAPAWGVQPQPGYGIYGGPVWGGYPYYPPGLLAPYPPMPYVPPLWATPWSPRW